MSSGVDRWRLLPNVHSRHPTQELCSIHHLLPQGSSVLKGGGGLVHRPCGEFTAAPEDAYIHIQYVYIYISHTHVCMFAHVYIGSLSALATLGSRVLQAEEGQNSAHDLCSGIQHIHSAHSPMQRNCRPQPLWLVVAKFECVQAYHK